MDKVIIKSLNIFLLFCFFVCHAAFSQKQKVVYEDKVFEENIQSARLFPNLPDYEAQMMSPVVELGGMSLRLVFDDLAYDPDMYSVKIVHCNFDWTPSDLKDPEILSEYNEFNVQEYNYSIDTRIPYIQYQFVLPRVRKSGNYAVLVYRGRDQNQMVLTKRFMVYQKGLALGAQIVPPAQTENRRQVQQINVNVNYKSRELFDPKNNLRVFIRQNQRWDNARVLPNPTMIREDIKMIEYQLFDGSNTFWAGNEFRFVDLRFVRARGLNVAAVKMEEDVVFAEAGTDKIRTQSVYSEYLDINGQYAVMNMERQNYERESEYMLVTFNLSAAGVTETPYIIGSMSRWGKEPTAKMELNNKTNTYQATLLLKQGWYDYQYAYLTKEGFDTGKLEGNYFETENEYEVFLYYRDMGSRYDELIGYVNLNPNKRRL
jgi:hypothetical protein